MRRSTVRALGVTSSAALLDNNEVHCARQSKQYMQFGSSLLRRERWCCRHVSYGKNLMFAAELCHNGSTVAFSQPQCIHHRLSQ